MGSNVPAIFEWWNLIYLLPFLLGLLQLLFSTFGLAMEEGAEHEVDHDLDHDLDHEIGHDVDHEVEVSHDVDVDQDVDVGYDVDVDPDVHVEHEVEHDLSPEVNHKVAVHEVVHHAEEPGLLLQFLAFYGVGKVPLSLIIQTFCFSWGVLGYAANQLLVVSRQPNLLIWPSLVIAFAGSTAITKGLAGVLGRLVPAKDTAAIRKRDLVGRVGKVVYTVTESSGTVHVRDDYGTLHQIAARVPPGQPSLSRGTEVVIVNYRPQRDWYWVEEWEEASEVRRMTEELEDLVQSVGREE